MAQRSCSWCKISVHDEAEKCPRCGNTNLIAKRDMPVWAYLLCEFIMCVLLIAALSYVEQLNHPTTWIMPDSFAAHDGAAPLPANTLLNDPPWPLAPFPNEAELEAKKLAPHPQK